MQYEKMKRNMIILLVVGVLVAIAFFWIYGYLFPYSNAMYSVLGILILSAFVFYPVALVYGRNQIIDLFHSIRAGGRQPLHLKQGSVWNPLRKTLNFAIACVITVFLGWLYGTYTAWQHLQLAKRFSGRSRR